METGLVHIYTGEGKGKTTAAVGLALRALSRGLKVCYVNFNKGAGVYTNSEVDKLKQNGAYVLIGTGRHPDFDHTKNITSHNEEMLSALKNTDKLIRSGKFEMLVLDEILISVRDSFLDEDILVDFLKNKPQGLEIVMTGRGATDRLIELADYVSEIKKVKHPFDKGIYGREGIEF